MRAYRRWTMEEKRRAVERMRICRHEKLAQELGIPKRQLYYWRKELLHLDRMGEAGTNREEALGRENRRLKEALATKVVETDFLRGVLRRIEARRRPSSGSGETASTKRSE
jgi:transposase-like protein